MDMGSYACPKCGHGNQRGWGRSSHVEITIHDGEIACVDAEEWTGEVECVECGEVYGVIYPPVGAPPEEEYRRKMAAFDRERRAVHHQPHQPQDNPVVERNARRHVKEVAEGEEGGA